jgi:hypothetical protein
MNPTIQILGLEAIKVDHSVQSRVAMNPFHMQQFSEAMLPPIGAEFPPVTTFFDGKSYWLADGFHRFGARKAIATAHPEFREIRAEVRQGTRTDAIIYSAGANKTFSIPRTKEDKERAVMLLRALPEWRARSNPVIARHVGVYERLAVDASEKYFAAHPRQRPKVFLDAQGNPYDLSIKGCGSRRTGRPAPVIREKKFRPRGLDGAEYIQFRASVDGKEVFLGTGDRAAAELALEAILADRKCPARGPDQMVKSDQQAIGCLTGQIVAAMKRRKIASVTITLVEGGKSTVEITKA